MYCLMYYFFRNLDGTIPDIYTHEFIAVDDEEARKYVSEYTSKRACHVSELRRLRIGEYVQYDDGLVSW
jgi:hypothetical protein